METTKHYPSFSDFLISGIEIHRVVKNLVRISEVEWRSVIHTRKD